MKFILFVLLVIFFSSCKKTVPLSDYEDLLHETDRLEQELRYMTGERDELQEQIEVLQEDIEECQSKLEDCEAEPAIFIRTN